MWECTEMRQLGIYVPVRHIIHVGDFSCVLPEFMAAAAVFIARDRRNLCGLICVPSLAISHFHSNGERAKWNSVHGRGEIATDQYSEARNYSCCVPIVHRFSNIDPKSAFQFPLVIWLLLRIRKWLFYPTLKWVWLHFNRLQTVFRGGFNGQ